jgi:aminopeptidase N
MRTPIFLVLLGATLALPVSAQQSAPTNLNLERLANGAYSRSHDYDLVHQRISVRDFNWDSLSFEGSVVTTLVSRRAGLDSVVLDAGTLLGVHRIVASSGVAVPYGRHGDTLVLHLPTAAGFGDTVRFTIDYAGQVTNGAGLTFIGERPNTPRQIWSQGEDHNNHEWFPTYDFPNDKMTWEVEATVPKGFVAISNGALVHDVRAGSGARTMHWKQDRPSATYLVSLIVAPLAKLHDSWHGVPVDYYVYHADSALARAVFHVTPDMIDTYSQLTGVPYPWAKYAQTTVADFFGGMENVSATTLVDWLPDANAYQDRPWYQYILIPHELAHQWFGDYVTTENWANMWLNEGFAEFMPGQYWGRKLGPHAEQDYYADEYRQFMGIETRRPMPLASLGSNNIYPKGALVLEMLKQYLGADRFWAGVHRYLTAHAFGNATSDDLRQAMLDATGQNLDWFWREWVYSAGYPSFTVTAQYDAMAHRVTMVALQTQRDSLAADSTGMRYVIPDAFRMPVVVRVGTSRGDIVHRAWLEHRADTIVVDSVMAPPTMVVFDDGNKILKSLTFEEPTAWLVTQLADDPDLWDRQWVLGQLAHRTLDQAAGTAIASTLTTADYPFTRAQAAGAISGFAPDLALPALTAAMRDTSSQVRAAAAAALGQVGGDKAIELVRAPWHFDQSYEVRAAAFNALVRLDPDNRRALIAEALRIASYQDVIQNAALIAIARTSDFSFDGQLQDMVGKQQLVSSVLAALAARGDQHALALITADLDDARQYVRQWALAAIGTMPKDQALAALTSAQPRLTHPDIEQRVAGEIARLNK